MKTAVAGAGAFGTALAIALAKGGRDVTLFCRDPATAGQMASTRKASHRLPGFDLPDTVYVTSNADTLADTTCLLAMPMQTMRSALSTFDSPFAALVACSKGIDQTTGLGPVELIKAERPDAVPAILTGPSFATDIAAGLPTALVIASENDADATRLQDLLTRPALRLYRTTDVTGAELGGALKNVIALAAGITVGAGLGDSARASVIARGFAELSRFALAKGAKTETLHGLSGLGDLVLTCTSDKSRNFSFGQALGSGAARPTQTTEGLATAKPVVDAARSMGLELPLMSTVADVVAGKLDIPQAITNLLARPVGKE
jgi:glycerol-3-phosphate dehydrogenase (NAD(P)+)